MSEQDTTTTITTGTKPLHERFGFETEDAMAEAFEKVKGDLTRYKGESREARDLRVKLEALEAEKRQREEAEMSESQKLSTKLAALEKQMQERDALIAAKDRAILTERHFASKLAGRPPEEAAIVRRLFDAAVAGAEFADETELDELLKPIEDQIETFRKSIGGGMPGPGVGPTGAPRPGVPGGSAQTSAAVADFTKLSFADQIRRAREGLSGRKG